jgi:hypothetical protein
MFNSVMIPAILLIVTFSFVTISVVDVLVQQTNDNANEHDHHHQRRRLTMKTFDNGEEEKRFLQRKHERHLSLFTISSEISTIGPTVFPKPTYILQSQLEHQQPEGEEIVTNLKPVSGQHRPTHDAVLLFAAEYPLFHYILFVTTLRDTGYDGDIVMAVSPMDWNTTDIKEYLESSPNVVVYVVNYECFNAEGMSVDSSKGGIRVCKSHYLYGKRPVQRQSNDENDGTTTTITPLSDPRHARTVQNSRYELYWIWSEYYNPTSWIMLIDARDTIFQRNPFDLVPRRYQDNKDEGGGLLLLFGENVEATRLGKSSHNRDWLTKAYGTDVADALADKPTICSGSTMGEQIAIETYLRAMVGESDETKTVKMGADQGFHNYLYYSNKLANAKGIRKILIQDQGYGIINNLGALRTKELNEWGNGKILDVLPHGEKNPKNIVAHNVLNWDGTLSPVVHQFDRHTELTKWWFKTKKREYQQRWFDHKKQQLA